MKRKTSTAERNVLTIVMPALNEEKNISLAIKESLLVFNKYEIEGEIIVINDGSTDRTLEIVEKFCAEDSRIRVIHHDTPKGIGASFWEGLDQANGNSILMLPGDNENDPEEILRYLKLIDHVDIIIPFVFNKSVRSIFRNALSFAYRCIINTTFMVNFNYTNGTILYRTSLLRELEHRSAGFFFQTDILIRSIKKGYLFAEVPYKLSPRNSGTSTAVTFPSFLQVARGYLNLTKDHYSGPSKAQDGNKSRVFTPDSLTAKRYDK